MKRIVLEIKALSPLAIARQKPGGSVSEVENYIPGSVIRGAIAAQILKESGHQSTNLAENGGDFQALFLGDEPAIFQNAYPATLEINKKLVAIERTEEIMVLPATTLSSKTDSGFKTQKGNGVFDTLIDRLCAEFYGYPYDPNCPVDGGRVDTVDFSFYSKYNDKYYKHSVNKRLLTRVGINRRRATAEEEILYSIEVLNESQELNQKPIYYRTAILVTDDLAEFLQQFIHNRRQDFRLGGSTSRGLGKVAINAKLPTDVQTNVKEKVKNFNDRLQERWVKWKDVFSNPSEELPSDRTYFTLDLQSDAILSDRWRRTTVISEVMLKYLADVDEDSSLKLEAAYSSYDYRSGWNAAWGLMKDVELVTNKGGVYLFSTTQPEKWFEKLGNLEVRGVGDRTCEGFGQVKICNEFHLVFRENPA